MNVLHSRLRIIIMSFIVAAFLTMTGCNSGVSSNSSSSTTNINKVKLNKFADTNNIVTVYLLIDNTAALELYIKDLSAVDKVNFNRVIFSFIRPTMPNYTSGDLTATGILGHFDESSPGDGKSDFKLLASAVALSKAKNIQTFISVGGWNYSCNYAIYGKACGDYAIGLNYDWFPDPTDPTQSSIAQKSYSNIVKLTNDLGLDGIDLDYEEFWHADYYADNWLATPDNYNMGRSIESAIESGNSPYNSLVKYGSRGSTQSGPAIMPKTVAKLNAIMHNLEDNPNAKNLMFATAAPPVGARPIMSFVYSDTSLGTVNEFGGIWWMGNLKGLWYNLYMLDESAVDRFDALGLMTYDLCGDDPTVCAPYGGAKLDLASQVDAYVGDYNNWLKNPQVRAESFLFTGTWKAEFFPAKYNFKPKIQFGFEVNTPAYPKSPSGQLPLTQNLVTTILANEKQKTNGVIIWQMYSIPDKVGSEYTIQQSCHTFLDGDSRYNCNADFPASALKPGL